MGSMYLMKDEDFIGKKQKSKNKLLVLGRERKNGVKKSEKILFLEKIIIGGIKTPELTLALYN